MKQNKNRYEIIIYGRGGQGAKTSAELLVQAALKKGKYVQAFPQFGPERSGAPVSAFVKISDRPIRSHEPITNPDCVLVLEESMIADKKIANIIAKSVPVIINSKKTERELRQVFGSDMSFVAIDASGLALEIIGENRPNTVILGKLAKISHIVDLKDLGKVFKEKYSHKLGLEKVKKNIKAIKIAYETDC